jgi:tRNA pseudouridine(55) synthase
MRLKLLRKKRNSIKLNFSFYDWSAYFFCRLFGKKLVGFLVFDKPRGFSSAYFCSKVKRFFSAKVGHCGTLDPQAQGLLLLAIDQATKFIRFLPDSWSYDEKGLVKIDDEEDSDLFLSSLQDFGIDYFNKVYEFDLQFGLKTDTADLDGAVLEKNDFIPSQEAVVNVLPDFFGQQYQTPPKFSAIKVSGRKSYDLARSNIEFSLKSRKVNVVDLVLVNHKESVFSFRICCSRGFYIRSFGEDFAKRLGAIGTLSRIERVSHGFFSLQNKRRWFGLEIFLKFYKNYQINYVQFKSLLSGVELKMNLADGIYAAFIKKIWGKKFVGIIKAKGGIIFPLRMVKE